MLKMVRHFDCRASTSQNSPSQAVVGLVKQRPTGGGEGVLTAGGGGGGAGAGEKLSGGGGGGGAGMAGTSRTSGA